MLPNGLDQAQSILIWHVAVVIDMTSLEASHHHARAIHVVLYNYPSGCRSAGGAGQPCCGEMNGKSHMERR